VTRLFNVLLQVFVLWSGMEGGCHPFRDARGR
jgi:hypothetical protein